MDDVLAAAAPAAADVSSKPAPSWGAGFNASVWSWSAPAATTQRTTPPSATTSTSSPATATRSCRRELVRGAGSRRSVDADLRNRGSRVRGLHGLERVRRRAMQAARSHQEEGSATEKVASDAVIFFYHPDHLGSTSYVTDRDGHLYEHVAYFPFGETWVEQASNTEDIPYLFTGKELDQETGLYYFGARYYDPRTSVWESADPLLMGIGGGGMPVPPQLSSYLYTRGNPLRYVDPTGLDGEDYDLSPVKLWALDPDQAQRNDVSRDQNEKPRCLSRC